MTTATGANKPKHSEQHFSPFDVFWLRNDIPENRMVICMCFQLEKDVDLPTVNAYMKKWATMFPRFRSRIIKKGKATFDWEPVPNFDPANMGCIAEHKLKTATQAELDTVVDSCINDALPQDAFQWKLYKISNVPWGGCLMMWRVHHCVCDGLALIQVIRSLFEVDDEPAEQTTRATTRRPRQPASRVLLRTVVKLGKLIAPVLVGIGIGYGLSLGLLNSFLLGASLMVAVMWGRPLQQSAAALLGCRRRETPTPLKNALCGVKCTTSMPQFATVNEVTAIASACSTKGSKFTINDVMCAMVGGAFRRYFTQLGYQPDKMTLRCVIPVSIRNPKVEFECDNQFTLVFANLPVHLREVQKRVRHMHEYMEQLKSGFEPLVGAFVVTAMSYLPDSWATKLVNSHCGLASLVVTNVNGRTQPCRFCDSKLTNLYGWVPSSGGIGVGVCMVTYMGKFTIGLMADKNQVSDLGKLAHCFTEEWKSMKEEVKALVGSNSTRSGDAGNRNKVAASR